MRLSCLRSREKVLTGSFLEGAVAADKGALWKQFFMASSWAKCNFQYVFLYNFPCSSTGLSLSEHCILYFCSDFSKVNTRDHTRNLDWILELVASLLISKAEVLNAMHQFIVLSLVIHLCLFSSVWNSVNHLKFEIFFLNSSFFKTSYIPTPIFKAVRSYIDVNCKFSSKLSEKKYKIPSCDHSRGKVTDWSS